MIPTIKRPFEINTPNQLERYTRIGIGGQAGSGKTHFTGTIGPDKKILFFDLEGGSETFSSSSFRNDPNAAPLENIHTISFAEFERDNAVKQGLTPTDLIRKIESALDYLIQSNNSDGYSVVVIDSLTELQEKFMSLYITKDPRQAYGAFRDSLHSIVSKVRNVKAHIIFLARLRNVEDEVQAKEVVRFELSPGAWSVISGLMSAIGYLTVKTQGPRSERVLDFGFNSRYQGKDRYSFGEVKTPNLKDMIATLDKELGSTEPTKPVRPTVRPIQTGRKG